MLYLYKKTGIGFFFFGISTFLQNTIFQQHCIVNEAEEFVCLEFVACYLSTFSPRFFKRTVSSFVLLSVPSAHHSFLISLRLKVLK